MPVEARRVADRFLEPRCLAAIGDDVEPETVRTVFRHPTLIRREQDRASWRAKPFDLDQAQISRSEVEARDVVAQVLIRDVVDLPPLHAFVLDDHAHGDGLGLEVWPEMPHFGRLTLGVWQREDARDPLHGLQRERPLTIEI